uniref:Retrovirus-related Pol polyprotein from transposon TNT 1-94 n=1 Tax=Cajanus cajan TaxID=3821 RepID=A0A151T9G8_CAJCA|nr:Retrovirus-related Pol polyprotein from transposon TNT 1-94 [Cajanus cajan]
MNTVRVVLALAAHFGWDLHQLDVKNAFLHGNLEEEVYTEIPPRAWFGRFTKAMVSLGYRQSQGDHTLFIKNSSIGKFTLLLVYVDDMIIIGDDKTKKLALKEKLAAQFEMKDLGEKGLLFKREDTLTMKIYTNADYAGSITDRKSTSGYCVFLGDSLVTWKCKKQDRVSRSSA